MALSAKVPTKYVNKISKDVIKTNKKKVHIAKLKESYGIYNYKVLIQAHPVSRIHTKSRFMNRSIFHTIYSSTYLLEFIHSLKQDYSLVYKM